MKSTTKKSFASRLALLLAAAFLLESCSGDKAENTFIFDSRRDLLLDAKIEFIVNGSSNSDEIKIDQNSTYLVEASIIYDGKSMPISLYRQGGDRAQGLNVLGSEVGTYIPIVASVPVDFNEKTAALYFSMDLPAGTSLLGTDEEASKLSAVKILSVPGLGLVDSALGALGLVDEQSSAEADDNTVELSVASTLTAQALFGGSTLDTITSVISAESDIASFKVKESYIRSKLQTVIQQLQEDVQTANTMTSTQYVPALLQGFIQQYNANSELKAEIDNQTSRAVAVFQDVQTVRENRQSAVNNVFVTTRAVQIEQAPASVPSVTSVSALSNSRSPTWTWTGSTLFRYRMDVNDFTSGGTETAAKSFTAQNLTEGEHTLYVQSKSAAGVWSASGSYTVVIDTTAPAAPTISGNALSTSATPTWTWAAVSGATAYRYRLDNSTLTSGATETSGLSYTPASPLSAGLHTLYVEARDSAGNWSVAASRTINVDTTPPTVSFSGTPNSGSSADTWINATVTGADISAFRYKIVNGSASCDDAAGYSSEMAPGDAIVDTVTAVSVSQTVKVCVQARDLAGNWATATPRSWTRAAAIPCSPGSYSSGGSCVAVGTGFYSTDGLTRSACANLPANASWFGTNSQSSTCAFICKENYLLDQTSGQCEARDHTAMLTCPEGQVIVGASGMSNGSVVKLGVRCRAFSEGAFSGSVSDGPSFGASSGSSFSFTCPDGSYLYRILGGNGSDTTVPESSHVANVTFGCRTLATRSTSNSSLYGTSGGVSAFDYTCSGAKPISSIAFDNEESYLGHVLRAYCSVDFPPTVTLTGAPSGSNTSSSLSVTVGGNSVTHYKYKMGIAGSTTCSSPSGYSSEIAIATGISDSLADYADNSSLKLCVVGRDSAGNWVNYTAATTATWTQTSPPSVTCDPGYYAPTDTCVPVGSGYYSTDGINRIACTTIPQNARGSLTTATDSTCPWVCNSGYAGSSAAQSTSCEAITVVSSDAIDDQAFGFTLPFAFKMFGTNYGNNANGGITYTSNNYLTFGTYQPDDWAQYYGFTAASPGRGLFMNSRDNMMTSLAMDPVTINGVTAFRIVYEGYQYGADEDTIQNQTIEIFSNQHINIIYGVQTDTSGVAALSNGTSYFLSGQLTPASNTVYHLSSDADGNNWVVTSGLYRPTAN